MKIFLRKQKYFSVSAHADKRCEMKIRSDAPLTRINIDFVDIFTKIDFLLFRKMAFFLI